MRASEEVEALWDGWDPDQGYGYEFNTNYTEPDMERFPRRTAAPGLHQGLSLVLNVEKDEYYCSGSESVGFKAMLHAPYEIATLVEYGFAISAGVESFLPIQPDVLITDESVFDIDIDKRNCYLQHEKSLKYYNFYSLDNCVGECAANYTFQVINAHLRHLPLSLSMYYVIDRNANASPIIWSEMQKQCRFVRWKDWNALKLP